jgi:hypothetical protein
MVKYEKLLAREALPAEQDPEGNWGAVTNGLQMSVRLYQRQFTNGQPVRVTILWRNVGSTPNWFTSATWENYTFDLSLFRDGMEIKPVMPRLNQEASHDGSVGGGLVEPHTQWRFGLRLDKIFDLSKPGAYQLRAEREAHGEGRSVFKLRSGTARFQVVAKPPEHEMPSTSDPRAATSSNLNSNTPTIAPELPMSIGR